MQANWSRTDCAVFLAEGSFGNGVGHLAEGLNNGQDDSEALQSGKARDGLNIDVGPWIMWNW